MKRLRGLFLLLPVLATVASCSVGGGQGSVTGTLNVANCWSGKFDLQPDFFGATPFSDQLTFRIQRGSDFENFSDGISILVSDGTAVRAKLGQPLSVNLPPEVSPPGVPVKATKDPAIVQLALNLQHTCRPETPALYAVAEATTNADGSCDDATVKAALVCDGAPPAVHPSTITFQHLFNGNPEEPDADKRLSEATFDVYLADPREICPGGLGPPPPCRGHIQGSFQFYFQRGRPAQAFP